MILQLIPKAHKFGENFLLITDAEWDPQSRAIKDNKEDNHTKDASFGFDL